MEQTNHLKLWNDPNASTKYVPIDSEKLIDAICSQDLPGGLQFELRSVTGAKSRKRSGQKHLIRLKTTKPVDIGGDECYPEIVIINSYDRSSPFRVEIGLFRMVCSNGMIVKSKDFGGFKTRHMGDEARQAQEIVEKFIQHLPEVISMQRKLSETILTEEQAIEFAMKAAQIRWNRSFSADDAQKLLEVARPEDGGMSAWTVFNRVQEKMLNGGVKLEGMKRTPRALRRVDAIFQTNNQLAELIGEMVEN